jgi:hypothetical protein
MARNVDAEIDGLYTAPPAEFVKRRDELAGSLRADGDRQAADEVKKLRKPSVAAWAVNLLARHEKMRLRALFTAGERLRAAHEQVLGGGPLEGLEHAREDERNAIGELAGAGRALLEEAGQPATEAVLDRVRETLHAAVVDDELGRRVREGRLEKEARATGFGFTSLPATTAKPRRPAPSGAKPARPKPARPEPARKPASDTAAAAKRRRAQERLKAARDALGEAERALKSKKRELAQAEREVERRRMAVETAQRAVERTPAS